MWRDLTKPLDPATLEIYAHEGYADPPLRIEPWCEIGAQQFAVQRVMLGTQTGTHVDAPAHFVEGGATLDALGVEHLAGDFAWIDTRTATPATVAAIGEPCPPLLFLAGDATLTDDTFAALLRLPCRVWIAGGAVRLDDGDPFAFHRRLAEAGRFLAEDLEPHAARAVTPGGELFVFPLHLQRTSGAPCRVVWRSERP